MELARTNLARSKPLRIKVLEGLSSADTAGKSSLIIIVWSSVAFLCIRDISESPYKVFVLITTSLVDR